MSVNYIVKADVIDITTDSPQKGDIFLVDTNVWYWLTYPHSINGNLIAAYLNLIRHNNQDIAPGLINLKYPDASIELPVNFPDVAKTPRFLYGDRLRWLSTESDTDWGIVIGRFYSFACDAFGGSRSDHRCCWSWCYPPLLYLISISK